jgi:hypothetical protein
LSRISIVVRTLILASILLLGLTQLAHAVPEICANGLDDDSSGGDAVCNYTDGYVNGQTTGTQCLDSNLQSVNGIPIYQVLHGEAYPCNFGAASNTNTATGGNGSNSGWHVCNSDGSWGTCTSNAVSPLCEATNGGHCYYVDYGSGSDTTGTGSYNTPWKTFRCVGYWSTGAPSCNVGLNPGDVVYQKGTTTYTDSYSYDGGTSANAVLVLNSGRSGNASFPVTIKRYPGATGTITCPGSWSSGTDDSETGTKGFCVETISASYVKWVDLDFSGGWGSAFYLNPGDHNMVYRNYVHDKDGFANDNVAGINSAAAIGVDVEWNRFRDVQDSHRVSSFNENIAAITFFNDLTGGDHTAKYNRIWWTNDPNYVGNIKGWGIKFKHGAKSVAQGGMSVGNNVAFNIVWNAQVGITCKTSSCYFTNNLVVNPLPGDYCFRIEAGDGSYDVNQDEKLTNNTCVNGHLVNQNMTEQAYTDSPVGPFDFESNVVYDTTAFGGDTAGSEFDQYGSDAEYTTYMPTVTLKNNLLWNTTTSGYKWQFFAANSGDGGHGPAGNAGATYTTLSSVQAIGGYGLEAGSCVQNPGLSSDGSFTPSSGCYTTQGWLGGAAPPPTPPPVITIDKRGRRIGSYNYHTR